MSEQQIDENVQSWSKRADKNDDGQITLAELILCLKAEGAENPVATAVENLKKIDKNEDGYISKDEIRNMTSEMFKAKLDKEIVKETNNFIKYYFGDKNKKITKDDVIRYYQRYTYQNAQIMANVFFETHDLNQNGFITFEELNSSINIDDDFEIYYETEEESLEQNSIFNIYREATEVDEPIPANPIID